MVTPTESVPNIETPLDLLHRLQQLRAEIYREGYEQFETWCSTIRQRSFLIGGLNLACYLALRRRDLRDLQAALAPLGLSSLGRSEPRVLANLDAVIATLADICRLPLKQRPPRPSDHAFKRGERMLDHNARRVLGASSSDRRVRIMVTMPTEAATDRALIGDLIGRGMSWARINCAHDDADVWSAIISNVRDTAQTQKRECRILMDLGGPKARTGEVLAPKSRKRLTIGDQLLLTRGKPQSSKTYPFQVECLIPEVFDQVQVGASIWIDDGRIGTQIESIGAEGAVLRVTNAREKGEKVRPDKGLNFPDTELQLSPLTEDDRRDLDFVVEHADAIGYSFVQSAVDVALLQQELKARMGEDHAHQMIIIAKIETAKAVRNLPEIIVQGAGQQPFGIMIARGDLAVEIGFERMAEIQEELLWLCEAAHVPVIWATQVLENFVKEGLPSRAEMTDAAMSERAECVMLNKGAFVAEAVTVLDHILTRMQGNQSKKTPQLRALHSW
ncbi:MAG: pyruvate kinase [Chloroflexota bacterium]